MVRQVMTNTALQGKPDAENPLLGLCKAMIVAGFAAGVCVAHADDLTLVGGSGTVNWNTTDSVWTNAAGASVAFRTGDNVLISSDSFTGGGLMMTERLTPGNVVFDISGSLLFGWGNNSTYGLSIDTKSFTKRGSGTLVFTSTLSGTQRNITSDNTGYGNALTCGVEIVEGELACKERNSANYLGPLGVPYWVYVRNGASLTFLEGNQTGTYTYPDNPAKIQLDSGSRLNNLTNAVSAEIQSALCINTLKLCGGDIASGPMAYIGNSTQLGSTDVVKVPMRLYNTLHFSGDMPHAFGFDNGTYDGYKHYPKSTTLGHPSRAISLNTFSPVEFRVDNIVEGVDAYVTMNMFTWGTNTTGVFRSDIVKTGPGTLCIPLKSYIRPFYGDFTIREGTVEFAAQGILPADGYSRRTLTVLTNATLRMTVHNVVDGVLTNTPNICVVVDHGTMEFTAGGCLQAKDWVFDDATLNIRNAGMDRYLGILYFKNSVTFRGTRPLEMWPNTELAIDNQAVHVHNGYRVNGDENGSRTTIDVADITGDGRTDVVMGYHIWNGNKSHDAANELRDSGFVKTGAGTFSVASMTNKVSGVVTVSNGTMRVDGKLVTPSSVEVAVGAYIGGTGTVANVSMESGAGFAAPAGQSAPLTVEGNFTLPATGVVNISNLDGDAENNIRSAKIVTATGTLGGTENLANWTVKIDGVVAPRWAIVLKDNVVYAKNSRGFVLIYK